MTHVAAWRRASRPLYFMEGYHNSVCDEPVCCSSLADVTGTTDYWHQLAVPMAMPVNKCEQQLNAM